MTMVTETLASVPDKPLLTVLFGDFQLGYFVDELLTTELGERNNLKFIHFRDATGLLKLSQEEHFDLTVVWLDHIDWGEPPCNDFDKRANAVIEFMTRLKTQSRKPILAIGGNHWSSDTYSQRLVQAGVHLLPAPFDQKELRVALGACLNIQLEMDDTQGITASPLLRPLRIVIVDDERELCELYEFVIRSLLKGVTVLAFQNGMQAWQELLREDPDFLISDINRCGLNGFETLRRLAERKVTYPILIASGMGSEDTLRRVEACSGPNLNVTLLSKPFTLEQLWADLFRRRCVWTLKSPFLVGCAVSPLV